MENKSILESVKAIFVLLFIMLLGFSLNVLFTLKLSGDDIGIRVAMTDILIPIALLILGLNYIKHKKFPALISKNGWKLLVAMSLWMLISLINGYVYTGEVSRWALINKFAGWFVLIAYFCVGNYVGIQNDKIKLVFFRTILVTGWFVCIGELLVHWVFAHGFFHQYMYIASHYRMIGFYQNPNAFGIYLSAIYVLQIFIIDKRILFGKTTMFCSSFLILLCVFYSYSRSAWLGLIFGVVSAALLNFKAFKYIVATIVAAYIMNFCLFSDYTKDRNEEIIELLYPQIQNIISGSQKIGEYIEEKTTRNKDIMLDELAHIENIINEEKTTPNEEKTTPNEEKTTPNEEKTTPLEILKIKENEIPGNKIEQSSDKQELVIDKKSDKSKLVIDKKDVREITVKDRMTMEGHSDRISIIKRSLSYWKDSPIIGIGLGSHIWNSKNENIIPSAITIHSSPNWLLVETGIIGFIIFSLFVLSCIKSLFMNASSDTGIISPLVMIVIVMTMLGASIGTEVLYQRYFWLLLGFFMIKKNDVKNYG